MLAQLHNWTPAQVDGMDADFIETYLIFLQAKQDQAEYDRKLDEMRHRTERRGK